MFQRMLENRGLNVKIAERPEEKGLTVDERYQLAKDRVEIAQAYSNIAKDFITTVTSVVVVGTVTVIAAKFASDFLKTAISKIR